MDENAEDSEIILKAGELRLRVSPFGASLRGMWRERADGTIQEIITGYSGAKQKVGGQGDVLIPFPGRVRDGKYSFNGESYEMIRNDKDGPNAIHGFLRSKAWKLIERNPRRAAFEYLLGSQEAPGYPFTLLLTVSYELTAVGELTCSFIVESLSETPAPFGAGFHPYFTVGSDLIDANTLTLAFDSFLEFENLLPTGKILPVAGTPFDFQTPRMIGDTAFNTCFAVPQRDADGRAKIRLSETKGNRAVTVWMNEAFNYVVLYSGDPLPESHRRRALAIEPMTCATDAFNHPEWGLVTLAPDATFAGAWGVTVEFGDDTLHP